MPTALMSLKNLVMSDDRLTIMPSRRCRSVCQFISQGVSSVNGNVSASVWLKLIPNLRVNLGEGPKRSTGVRRTNCGSPKCAVVDLVIP